MCIRVYSWLKRSAPSLPPAACLLLAALLLASLPPLSAAAPAPARPVAGAGPGARTLLLYANTRPAYALADGLELLKLRLGRVATRLEAVALSNAAPAQVTNADYIVVYCPQYFPVLPRELLDRIIGAGRPLLWIGFGADQVAARKPFEGQFEVSAFAAGGAVTNVHYHDRDWPATVSPWIPVSPSVGAGSRVLVSCRVPGERGEVARPICWTTGQATFFLAEPAEGILGFLFEDVLFDFYKVRETPPRRVFVRIEDYHCRSNHRLFHRMVDYLHARGHPFMVGVIPFFRDPATGELLEPGSQPEFVEALRYAQRRGGRLVARGYAGSDRAGAGEDPTLWDSELDRPVAPGREDLENRIQAGTRALLRQELLVLAWETPRYAAARAAYPEIARVFSTGVERVQLSDATGLARADIGGLTTDRDGRIIVPENLGCVRSGPGGLDEAMAARARVLAQLRGTVAGGFLYAYQPVEKLAALVEMLEDLQAPFLDLADMDNRVALPDAILLTGNAEDTVTLRSAAVRWKAYDRGGHPIAQKEDSEPSTGERTFRRTGTGDCEVYQLAGGRP